MPFRGVAGPYPGFPPAIPGRGAGCPRVTRPFAALCTAEAALTARLACVRRAASVRPEPGSNSPSKKDFKVCLSKWIQGIHERRGLVKESLLPKATFCKPVLNGLSDLLRLPQYPVLGVRAAAPLGCGARENYTRACRLGASVKPRLHRMDTNWE